MPDNVYSVTELVGTSTKSVDEAIRLAVRTAGKSLRHLDWFEVSEIRGHIEDADVAHFQVKVKIGFRVEDK
ncbi:MAG: dodecin [Rhodospirillales bacterium]